MMEHMKNPMKHSYLPALIAAVVLVLLTGAFLMFGESKPQRQAPAPLNALENDAGGFPMPFSSEDYPVIDLSQNPHALDQFSDETPPADNKESSPEDAPDAPWRANAVPVASHKTDQPRIVVIIDDMGMDHKRSEKILQLPAPLTLAFLPYAPHVAEMAARAHDQGHELMVHMPMEPLNPDLDTGPMTLRTGQDEAEFQEVLQETLGAFDHYVGINNHMGSRLTQDEAAMTRLMKALKARGLLFVDSRTIANSVAAHIAAEQGVPYASRDVFLDHDPSIEGVKKALRHVERIARTHGLAIAIGHPKDNTITGLTAWLPTLEAKGFVIIPISEAVIAPRQ